MSQGAYDRRESSNKALVEVSKSEEALDFLNYTGGSLLEHCLDLLGIYLDTIGGDDQAEESDFLLVEFVLVDIKL